MATKSFPSAERIRHLYVMQTKGKSKSARTRARNELEALAREMQRTANSRLKRLQQSQYAYGSVYDTTMQYLQSTGRKSFTLPEELKRGGDIGAQGYHYILRLRGFLRSKETTISGQKEIEKKRFDTFRSNPIYGDMADNMSNAELRGFLKFLGNSGVDDYLDVFGGNSGDEVEELMQQYTYADEVERMQMEELFKQFKRFTEWQNKVQAGLSTQKPTDDMLSFSELRGELNKLYESIEKRRR